MNTKAQHGTQVHTLTIKLHEKYIPDGDDTEFQATINRVINDIAGRAHTLVERHLRDDVDMTVSISHAETEGKR